MRKVSTRRHFLQAAPLAATIAIASPLTELASSAQSAPPEKFKLIPGTQFEEAVKALHTNPGNFNFCDASKLPFTAVVTVEEKKAAKEFEWHEGRDHLLHILDGTTVYELGGTPQNGRNTKPGEWLAPASQGATTLTLHKGDWVVIPRNTLHKRTTETTVTFVLISTTGATT